MTYEEVMSSLIAGLWFLGMALALAVALLAIHGLRPFN